MHILKSIGKKFLTLVIYAFIVAILLHIFFPTIDGGLRERIFWYGMIHENIGELLIAPLKPKKFQNKTF